MMPKEESKKQLITRATQYGVDPISESSFQARPQCYYFLLYFLL